MNARIPSLAPSLSAYPISSAVRLRLARGTPGSLWDHARRVPSGQGGPGPYPSAHLRPLTCPLWPAPIPSTHSFHPGCLSPLHLSLPFPLCVWGPLFLPLCLCSSGPSLQPCVWRGSPKFSEEEYRAESSGQEPLSSAEGQRQGGRAWGQLPTALPAPLHPPSLPPGFSCLSCNPELLNLVISVVLGAYWQGL